MFVSGLKEFDLLIGNDKYIVIGTSSKCTVEVFNISTWQEETIEGDYCDNGNISHYNFTNKGNVIDWVASLDEMADNYKKKITAKVNELQDFYFA
jgi:hypothetical protein